MQENSRMSGKMVLGGLAVAASLWSGAARAADFPADKATAVVSGKVSFGKGVPPKRDEIATDQNKDCHVLHKGKPLLSETVIIDDNGGVKTVRNVFVYVKSGLDDYKFPVPAEPVVLDQVGCQYTPHVFGIMVGQSLEIRNSDPLAHNVHSKPAENKEFNISQATSGVKNTTTFQAAEVLVPFKCDVHGWMQCYVGVTTHPFFAVTDSKGEFTLPKLPPGKYVIAARHETGKEKTVEITVAAGDKAATANFEFGRLELREKK